MTATSVIDQRGVPALPTMTTVETASRQVEALVAAMGVTSATTQS